MFKRKFVTKTGKVIVNYGPLALNRMSCLIDTFSTKFVSPNAAWLLRMIFSRTSALGRKWNSITYEEIKNGVMKDGVIIHHGLGWTNSTIHRHIKELEDNGLLMVQKIVRVMKYPFNSYRIDYRKLRRASMKRRDLTQIVDQNPEIDEAVKSLNKGVLRIKRYRVRPKVQENEIDFNSTNPDGIRTENQILPVQCSDSQTLISTTNTVNVVNKKQVSSNHSKYQSKIDGVSLRSTFSAGGDTDRSVEKIYPSSSKSPSPQIEKTVHRFDSIEEAMKVVNERSGERRERLSKMKSISFRVVKATWETAVLKQYPTVPPVFMSSKEHKILKATLNGARNFDLLKFFDWPVVEWKWMKANKFDWLRRKGDDLPSAPSLSALVRFWKVFIEEYASYMVDGIRNQEKLDITRITKEGIALAKYIKLSEQQTKDIAVLDRRVSELR